MTASERIRAARAKALLEANSANPAEVRKTLRPCANCGLNIVYTGEGKHPCAYCGHSVKV